MGIGKSITTMGFCGDGRSIAHMGWMDCGCCTDDDDKKQKKKKGVMRIQPAQIQRIEHHTRVPILLTISQAHQLQVSIRLRVILQALSIAAGTWDITTQHILTAPIALVPYEAERHTFEIGGFV